MVARADSGVSACVAGLGPLDQAGQLAALVVTPGVVQLERSLVEVHRHLIHPLKAGVVGAALQHGEVDPAVERGGQERQVHLEELILERLGGGGDHRALARQYGRHQVGERLAGAGARLHDQVAFVGNRLGHRPGHLHLPGPLLTTAGQGPGDRRQGPDDGVWLRRGAIGGRGGRSVGHGGPNYLATTPTPQCPPVGCFDAPDPRLGRGAADPQAGRG